MLGVRARSRLLRGCLLLFGVALLCAVAAGVLIANNLIGALEQLTTAPPVTALPLNAALVGIHSLRAAVRVETSAGETLLAGEAIFAPPADIYATWRAAGGEAAYVRADGVWYQRAGLDWSATERVPPILSAFEDAATLHDLLSIIGLMLSDDMAGWRPLDTSTEAGRRVRTYARSLQSLTPWDVWLGVESVDAEVMLGMLDHLPYQIRYTVRGEDETRIITITLSGFNDPLDIASPE